QTLRDFTEDGETSIHLRHRCGREVESARGRLGIFTETGAEDALGVLEDGAEFGAQPIADGAGADVAGAARTAGFDVRDAGIDDLAIDTAVEFHASVV